MSQTPSNLLDESRLFETRLYFTGTVTLLIWGLLAWNHSHGGVPSHHILADKDLPKISNWWGGLLLPLLTWFLLTRVQKRAVRDRTDSPEATQLPRHILYGLAGGLLFGALLSVFFTFDYSEVPGYMLLGLIPLALFLPIYRAECLLGFVLGMTFTFGAVLPTGIGTILASLCAILYLLVRPAIRYVVSRLSRALSPAN